MVAAVEDVGMEDFGAFVIEDTVEDSVKVFIPIQKNSWLFSMHIRDLPQFFAAKTQTANLINLVCSFALSRFRVLAKHSWFSAAMLFFVKPQCFTLSAKNHEEFNDSSSKFWHIIG